MTELDNILSKMDDVLFSSSEPGADANDSETGDAIYQETVSNELAKELLGDKYKKNCTYKIITSNYNTVIAQFDLSVPEDDERRVTEFELNTDNDVQTLGELQKELHVSMPKVKESTRTLPFDYGSTSNRWWIISLFVIGVCLIVGVLIIYGLLNYS